VAMFWAKKHPRILHSLPSNQADSLGEEESRAGRAQGARGKASTAGKRVPPGRSASNSRPRDCKCRHVGRCVTFGARSRCIWGVLLQISCLPLEPVFGLRLLGTRQVRQELGRTSVPANTCARSAQNGNGVHEGWHLLVEHVVV